MQIEKHELTIVIDNDGDRSYFIDEEELDVIEMVDHVAIVNRKIEEAEKRRIKDLVECVDGARRLANEVADKHQSEVDQVADDGRVLCREILAEQKAIIGKNLDTFRESYNKIVEQANRHERSNIALRGVITKLKKR